GLRVDGGDGLVEFGGDVEDVAVGVVDGKVWADAMAEIDSAGDFASRDVDDEHLRAISAGGADASAAVDGHLCGAPVRAGGDFVAAGGVLLECGDLAACGDVDEGDGFVFLVGNEDGSVVLGDGGGAGYEQAGSRGVNDANLHGREFTWRRIRWDRGSSY